jgi:ketosteroid isomerase-like protein
MNTITTSGGMRENPQIMLEIFRAVERRDAQRFAELVHPEFEIHWPPSLPYGGTYRDLEVDARQGRPTWAETWNPLQPTGAERRMDPRVVAVSDDGEETVVLWRQRGLSPAGERFDGPVLGLYRLRDGKLTRAQMFYFDTVALASFLAEAKRQATTPKPEAVDR